jgi:hypothetical protein
MESAVERRDAADVGRGVLPIPARRSSADRVDTEIAGASQPYAAVMTTTSGKAPETSRD